MDLQKATEEIISFLVTVPFPKILCIGMREDNNILKERVYTVLKQNQHNKEFDFRKDGIFMISNKYDWFCKFINLTEDKERNMKMLTGFTAERILIVDNNIPSGLNHVYIIISSYLTNNNKTELIRIWT